MRRIQNNTLSYRYCVAGIEILNPRLPIEVTPEFDSIFFHLMGDGNWGNKKGTCAGYKQTNDVARENFVKKIKRVFGKFTLISRTYNIEKGVLIPKIIPKIIAQYYDIKESHQTGSCGRIPKAVKRKPKEFKLAGLIAFLVDEGYIGDSIELYSHNYKLLSDMRGIISSLGY